MSSIWPSVMPASHASLRHRATRHHHQNCVAPKSYGLAPNSTALVPSRIATPGSSTAERNSSGSALSWTSLAARTIDCCSNTIAVYRHSFRHSSQNPPRLGDSCWRLGWTHRFVYPRSCRRSGSPRCQNPVARVHGPWRCLALPKSARHSRCCPLPRWSPDDCSPRQPSTAAALATVGSGARSVVYCLLYCPYCLNCSASSTDHLPAPPSGQPTSCSYSPCGPARGLPPLPEQSEPRPTGFAPTPAVFACAVVFAAPKAL